MLQHIVRDAKLPTSHPVITVQYNLQEHVDPEIANKGFSGLILPMHWLILLYMVGHA